MAKLRKPVTLLTGFLGSGKTTFLNHMIQKSPNIRYAIIENEFGEQGIDSELIYRPDNCIVEMNNGCLCCTLNDNLYDILNDLFDRRNEFDEIIIEATGVADPAGLAEPFLTHPLIQEHFPLMGTICLIDTEQVEDQIAATEEALNQITFSDILFLNKTDLVSSAYAKEVEGKIQPINPLAKIYVKQNGKFPEFNLSQQKEDIEEQLRKQIKAIIPSEGLSLRAPSHHHHHEHTPNVVSFCFTFAQPFSSELLYHHLFVYLTFQSKNLYRIKGLLWLAENDKQMVIQTVGKRMNFEEKRPWKEGEKRESIIVFIGKDLKEKGLKLLLNKCLQKIDNTKNN
jgi:G3E family GTPase